MNTSSLDLESFKADLDILDRYQAFSGELLRMALLGVAGVGFLITSPAVKGEGGKDPLVSLEGGGTKSLLCASLMSLGCCVASCLLHRFFSTESMSFHLSLLRRAEKSAAPSEEKDIMKLVRAGRDKNFRRSTRTIYLAAGSLFLGAVLLAAAFILAIKPWSHWGTS